MSKKKTKKLEITGDEFLAYAAQALLNDLPMIPEGVPVSVSFGGNMILLKNHGKIEVKLKWQES